jgi:hypothetical protein
LIGYKETININKAAENNILMGINARFGRLSGEKQCPIAEE